MFQMKRDYEDKTKGNELTWLHPDLGGEESVKDIWEIYGKIRKWTGYYNTYIKELFLIIVIIVLWICRMTLILTICWNI